MRISADSHMIDTAIIDKAFKKNVLHKNNGANKKSKINNFVKTTLTSK